jgi:hypothetical protein
VRSYLCRARGEGRGRAYDRTQCREEGRGLGLLHIEERPRPGWKHLANAVRITSREWQAWIDRKGPARPKELMSRPTSSRSPRPVGLIGVKKLSTTARLLFSWALGNRCTSINPLRLLFPDSAVGRE